MGLTSTFAQMFNASKPAPSKVVNAYMLIDYIVEAMNDDPEYKPTVFIKAPVVHDVPPECIPIENEYFLELQAVYQ